MTLRVPQLPFTKSYRLPAVMVALLCIGSSLSQPANQPGQRSQPIETGLNKRPITQLEQDIPRLMAEGDIPGLSIAVVSDGKVAWSRGFGVKNSETKEPVDDNTVFEAASLSKPVFAYAVLKLVEMGKLDLDTPLTKYLPGKYDVGDDPRLDQITTRHVLSHTTGFPNWRPRGDTTLKIYFTPGDRFSYSGEGFVYLSRVVEQITGEKLDLFLNRAVLDPLGMRSSSYVWRDDYEARKTFSHNSVGRVSGRGKPDKVNAAASLQTTATDYARFICAIINGTGLKPETARLMLTPQISVDQAGANNLNRPEPKLSAAISWGLGWGLQKTAEGTSFWHWGDNGDTKAYVVALPQLKKGVVIFANSANGLSIVRELVDETLGGQQPALSWINYESYNSPARLMFKAILKSDAETVLADYRKRRLSFPMSKDQSPKSMLSQSTENPILTESQMNTLGYQLLSLKRVKDAIALFTQNTVDFPNAFNTWDSLAEAYMISGDKVSAIKYYKKSLELNPDNTNAVQKLKELG
jgi:CubicO group peptidase (beta-lactamase class C family)